MSHPHATSSSTYGYIPNFLDVLASPAGSLPKSVCWVMEFDNLKEHILPAIQEALLYEPGGSTGSTSWAIEKASDIISGAEYQTKAGCVLCQAIDIPGFDTNAIAEGNLQYNSYIRSYVGQGRVDFPIMRASFLDTNISFADNVLRPWALATGTFGLLARAKGTKENYRTNMYCYQLGSLSNEVATVIKKFSFFDVCCISVNNEELNYTSATQPIIREAKFLYNYYTIETDTNLFVGAAADGLKPKTMAINLLEEEGDGTIIANSQG